MNAPCPSPAALESLVSGRLAGEEAARVREHAASCPACREKLDQLSGATATAGPSSPRNVLAGALERGVSVGRYLVLHKLGEGGMGAVYAAYDPELDRRVALKLLKVDGAESSADERSLLLDEAKAMAKLSHPNVVAVHDAGLHQGEVFVAMELVAGKTLRDWAEAGPHPWREVVRVFAQAGQGLVEAHRAGIVHRDFKPDNVFVGDDGRVRVGDFGLALRSGGCASPRGLAGTPAYMSPEQLRGDPADARSDQFSFCVSLWEALFGERPFDGADLPTIADNVLSGRLRLSPQRSVPAHLRAALLRGLKVRPEERWPGLVALLAELRRDPARTWRRRLVYAGVALLALGTFALGIERWQQERTRCGREGEAELALAWGAPARAKVRAALKAAGAPAAAADEAVRALDDYAAAWRQTRLGVCESARADPAAARPAAECLAERLARLDAAAQLFAKADPEVAGSLPRLLGALEPPRVCVAVQAVPAWSARDPELRARLERVRAVRRVGKAAEAAAGLEELQREAVRAGDGRLAAEARLERARLRAGTEAGTASTLEAMREAALEADAIGADEVGFAARVDLFTYLSEVLDRRAEAIGMAREAEAWLRRLGKPPHLELQYASAAATLASRDDRPADALALHARALELARAVWGPRHRECARIEVNLASSLAPIGRHREALARLEDAAAIFEEPRWREARVLLVVHGNASNSRLALAEFDEALRHLDRASALLPDLVGERESYGAWLQVMRGLALEGLGRSAEAAPLFAKALETPDLLSADVQAEALAAQARRALAEGREQEALERAERALEIAIKRSGERGAVARSRFTLARAQVAAGRERAAALALARQALQVLDGPDDGPQREPIERWIRESEGAAGR